MIQAKILFYDGNGNFKQEEMSAINMNQLESMADLLASDLEKRWNQSVKWRKINHPSELVTIYKTKIDLNFENEFEHFLNEQSLYFKKHVYAPKLIIWRIDIPYHYEISIIKQLPYIKKFEEMPMITLD